MTHWCVAAPKWRGWRKQRWWRWTQQTAWTEFLLLLLRSESCGQCSHRSDLHRGEAKLILFNGFTHATAFWLHLNMKTRNAYDMMREHAFENSKTYPTHFVQTWEIKEDARAAWATGKQVQNIKSWHPRERVPRAGHRRESASHYL